GIAVTGTMVVTALLAFIVVWKVWGWRWYTAAAGVLPFLVIDFPFLAANLLKVVEGGWFPLLLGGLLIILMVTWRRGNRILFEKTRRREVPLLDLINSLEKHPPERIEGTAVFLTSDPESTPTALLHSMKHFKVLHRNNVILTVVPTKAPRIHPDDRVTIEFINPSFARMTVHYGFMETPNVPKALAAAKRLGWTFDIMNTSFFLSRRSIKPAAKSAMPHWQDRIYAILARNADDAS